MTKLTNEMTIESVHPMDLRKNYKNRHLIGQTYQLLPIFYRIFLLKYARWNLIEKKIDFYRVIFLNLGTNIPRTTVFRFRCELYFGCIAMPRRMGLTRELILFVFPRFFSLF